MPLLPVTRDAKEISFSHQQGTTPFISPLPPDSFFSCAPIVSFTFSTSAASLLLLALLSVSLFAHDRPLPKLEGLLRYGCSVELMVPEQQHWHLYVWAEHAENGPDWKMLYSEHSGKNGRHKCLTDCDAWMRLVERVRLRQK